MYLLLFGFILLNRDKEGPFVSWLNITNIAVIMKFGPIMRRTHLHRD